jgi:hypothetical protein
MHTGLYTVSIMFDLNQNFNSYIISCKIPIHKLYKDPLSGSHIVICTENDN